MFSTHLEKLMMVNVSCGISSAYSGPVFSPSCGRWGGGGVGCERSVGSFPELRLVIKPRFLGAFCQSYKFIFYRFADVFTGHMKLFLIFLFVGSTGSFLWFSLLCQGIIPFARSEL